MAEEGTKRSVAGGAHLCALDLPGAWEHPPRAWVEQALSPPGKSNPYCEVTMGSQCHITKTMQDTLNPKWNSNCQFFIRDLEQEVLCITVFERDQFSPDGECLRLPPEPFFPPCCWTSTVNVRPRRRGALTC